MPSFERRTSNWGLKGQLCLAEGATENLRETLGVAKQLAAMKAKCITSEWYPFNQVYVHESETAQPIPLLTTTSGAPVATAEGAEMLGITADKLVMACRHGAL